MSELIKRLKKAELISPPKWLLENVHYAVYTGSVAYGASNDTSDMDIYGFAIPPKDDMFPHLRGDIPGFGKQKHRFAQWQEHHVVDKNHRKEYDFSVYSIVKYFDLCMMNNPNMVDTLFVPQRCVLHCTAIGQLVRDNRKMFLHKGAYHKFRGYAYAQLSKIGKKTESANPKRQASINAYGYDVKFAYHVVRLALECEQILIECDLDIEQNREVLKAIRRGEWSLEKLKRWFDEKESALENLYTASDLRHKPDEGKIKDLLLNCIEMHYGSVSNAITRNDDTSTLVKHLDSILDRYRT